MAEEITADISTRLRELEGERRVLRARLKSELHPTIIPQGHFSVLICRVGDTSCGIPASQIEQVVPVMWLDPLPESPPWLAGTFNLAGVTVPTVDILARWEQRTQPFRLEEKVVVVKVDGETYGLMVQGVTGTRTVQGTDIEPWSEDVPVAQYVLGVIGADHLLLLDSAELVRHTGFTERSS